MCNNAETDRIDSIEDDLFLLNEFLWVEKLLVDNQFHS